MFKRELRLAVVIYGGASLAVYMHGVTKELLKLVRASKAFHELGRERALRSRYADAPDPREADTEAVYFELVKRINEHCHFRVVVDVIAGASAGAINGVMLGKAIVDDGLLEVQTPLWLNDADVEHMAPPGRSRWQKWYLQPLLRALAFWLPGDLVDRPETREKLTRLVRSSWFQPPFSGEVLCKHFFAALQAMIASRRSDSTLLPPGGRLDVFASLTDLNGYPSRLRLNEALVASDREHAAFCRLSHLGGAPETDDFADANLPALVWAARASSSFAGAFPPFRHAEMTRVIADIGIEWPEESRFLREKLFTRQGTPAVQTFDPRSRVYVDGGIVDNKPFGVALQALAERPADRHVDRYVVYIEPDPAGDAVHSEGKELGYLSTIRAALSTIPRNQPIVDQLDDIVDQDRRAVANRRIVEANEARIEAMVAKLRTEHESRPLSPELVAYLREASAAEAATDMGLAYVAYVQRRVWRLTEALIDEWVVLAEQPHRTETRVAMTESIAQWWRDEDVSSEQRFQDEFIDRFDVTFRIRRLQFVIRRLNQHDEVSALGAEVRAAFDEFKRVAYGFLERLYVLRRARRIDAELLVRLFEAARDLPLPQERARTLLKALASSLDLDELDREIDAAVYRFCDALDGDSTSPRTHGGVTLRQVFLTDYVAFPAYDVLLFSPTTADLAPDPLTRVRIERISPRDAPTLKDAFEGLRSRRFMGLLGFFNRGFREHDYLWGRLNGADRIVDLLCNVVPEAAEALEPLRNELFRVILARERRRLYRCDDELARIAALLDAQSEDNAGAHRA